MGNKSNFIEIAEYCVKQMKETHNSHDNEYKSTLFCAFFDNYEYKVSSTPQILRNANHCLLIHTWMKLAYTNRYPHTLVETIDTDGVVHRNGFADGYKICCENEGTKFKTIELKKDNVEIYRSTKSEEIAIPRILEVVKQTQNASNAKEAQLIAKLLDRDIEIDTLKKDQVIRTYKEKVLLEEVNVYRALFNEFIEKYEKLLHSSMDKAQET